ncbi:hypothetical protein DXG01_016042, partial [Tephrocybe rancida]
MPEIRECLAHYFYILWFFQWWIKFYLGSSLKLVALWADACTGEATHIEAAGNSHVYRLGATSTIYRGANKAQTSLWLEMWKKTAQNPDPPSIQTLELKAVDTTSRAIILDMGLLRLK